MRIIKILFLLFSTSSVFSQTVESKLQKAYSLFEKDSQLLHAISSLYVVESNSGQIIFEKNASAGLAGASTQKVITAATAFELLGKDFRYETQFASRGDRLIIIGKGDPTLGSSRYSGTKESEIYSSIVASAKKSGLTSFGGIVISGSYDERVVPDGWINQDMGNYYGAASHAFNWKENQYDLVFIPGLKKGDSTSIDNEKTFYWSSIINNCTTGAVGSGDNAYIYFLPASEKMLVRGTIPAGGERFTIRGADPYPARSFTEGLKKYTGDFLRKESNGEGDHKLLFMHYSPRLDSISYWFLRESINLYGEALVNTIGERRGRAVTDSGTAEVVDFWAKQGIDKNELNIYDGSGLSPLNRITTHAQVQILKYAKGRPWFPQYLSGFKETNGMKMKSGTINDVKGYCGYYTSKEGKEYVFSFLVNNYNGRSSSLVTKMFKVLDALK